MRSKPAELIGKKLLKAGLTLAIAESCTGGLTSSTITDTPGSSKWFRGAVIAYSNDVKVKLLGVPKGTLEKHGAVSKECAILMAKGVRKRLKSSYAIATTGIAGPSGGTPDKPVGTVFLALTDGKTITTKKLNLKNKTRRSIKKATTERALRELNNFILKLTK
jgi:PncC family amidohydrolase